MLKPPSTDSGGYDHGAWSRHAAAPRALSF
jgi:hypothetical protein